MTHLQCVKACPPLRGLKYVPRKPKPLPVPQVADPSRRFNTILMALLAVKKEELQKIEDKLNKVKAEQ